MGRRDSDPDGERAPEAVAEGVTTPIAETLLRRAQLLVECTRAIFRAHTECELGETLCRVIVQPGLYTEAAIVLVGNRDAGNVERFFYAGPQKECLRNPAGFWHAPESQSALQNGSGPSILAAEYARPSYLMLPLRTQECTLGTLALVPDGGRYVDAGELAQLQALADDMSSAMAALRQDAPRQKLAMSEKRLRETIEHAGVGIIRIDMDGRFIDVNQKFCEMLGYTRGELIGRFTRDFTVPEDYGAGPAFRARAQAGEAGVLIGEKRYVHKDGSHVWVRRTMSAALDENGNVGHGISVVEDITERKVAEEAARSERTLLKTIIDALPDFVHVKDAQGRIRLGNAAWLKGRSLDSASVQGKTVFDIFPRPLAQRMDQQDRRIMESGHPMIDQEVSTHVLDATGARSERWSLTTKVPMRNDGGEVIGIVGISRDITARRRLERERAMEHAITRVLSEATTLGRTMTSLIRTMCETMEWAYGARWTWDADSGYLSRAEWWADFQLDFEPSDRQGWLQLAPDRSGRLLRKAWLEQQATWIADLTRVENFRRLPSCIRFGLRSALAFPVIAHNQPLGVLEFFGREVREPDDALLQVTTAIGRQIGQFVARKRTEEALQESEQQLRAMFEHADVGIAVTALDGRYLRVNDKYCAILGYRHEELLNMEVCDVNLEENVEITREQRQRLANTDAQSSTTEKQLVRKDGSLVWASIAISVVRASDGSARYFIAVIQDISESKRAAEALRQSEEQFRILAQYDILTGLPNRALFYDRLTHALAQAKRNRCALAVLFIDVDRFKHVNDTFGHAVGDQLLKHVSERLAGCVRSDDTVGRLSGDEFAIVLTRLTAPEDAGTVAKKIIDSLNAPFPLEGTELFVTVSIGITVYPGDSNDQDTLIRNADVAMYRAKERGRNNYQFYTPEMNRRTRELLNLEGELRRALERNEFVLHYQPKVSLTSMRVTGVEALLRWRHPERGLVPPADFMPLLEETGLIVQAGSWVLRAVCGQLMEWRRSGIRPVPIAVNLSARQFLAPDLGQGIRAVLQEHALMPDLLEIEITESSIMVDTQEAIRTLEYLQALGVRSAIDDFGTGYSSLGYLKRFPLRALKIDRSFVRDITTDPDDATITQAVISMAHSLHLKVVAEGVETAAQLAFLRRYGCDEVQGFLFSRPLPGSECAAFIADDSRIPTIIASLERA